MSDGKFKVNAATIQLLKEAITPNTKRTDEHRLNWLEFKNRFSVSLEPIQVSELAIDSLDKRWVYEVRFYDKGALRRFHGESLRSAIDSGMDAEKK